MDGPEKDLPPGEQLLALLRPFLEYLAASDLSPKTIQKSVDNIRVVGGEFIRDLHNDPSLRKRPVDRVLSQRIENGAPLPRPKMGAGPYILYWSLYDSLDPQFLRLLYIFSINSEFFRAKEVKAT